MDNFVSEEKDFYYIFFPLFVMLSLIAFSTLSSEPFLKGILHLHTYSLRVTFIFVTKNLCFSGMPPQ